MPSRKVDGSRAWRGRALQLSSVGNAMQQPSLIPRGIADAEGAHGYVRAADALVAVDLATGAVRWRSPAPARPLVLVEGLLAAARGAGPHGFQLASLDVRDGGERLTSGVVPLPPWVVFSLDDGPGFALRAAADGREAVVQWVARARYGGGAPPPPEVAAAAQHDARGTVRFDPQSGTLREGAAGDDVPEPPAAEPGAPGVIESRRISDLQLELVLVNVGPGCARVVLRSVDPATASERWTLALEEVPVRPRPPRP